MADSRATVPAKSPWSDPLLWLGPVVAFAGAVSYFLLFARFPALRDFPWVNLPLVLAGVALSVAAVARAGRRRGGRLRRVPAVLGLAFAVLLATAFCAYVFHLSYQVPQSAVARGLERAPEFSLRASDGSTVALSDFAGRPVVLVFYRGFW